MACYAVTVTHKRSASEVFATLADLATMPMWEPAVAEIDPPSDATRGKAFDVVVTFYGQRITMRATIVEVSDEHLVLHAEGSRVSVDYSIAVRPLAAGGSEINLRCEAKLRRMLRLFNGGLDAAFESNRKRLEMTLLSSLEAAAKADR